MIILFYFEALVARNIIMVRIRNPTVILVTTFVCLPAGSKGRTPSHWVDYTADSCNPEQSSCTAAGPISNARSEAYRNCTSPPLGIGPPSPTR